MSLILASAMRSFRENYGSTQPEAGFTLVAHPETRPWLTNTDCIDRLRAYFKDPSMVVRLYPRSQANRVLGRHAEPYAFRAFTRDDVSHIFIDRAETPTSLCWIIGHELTHQRINKNPDFSAALNAASARGTGLDPAGDTFHEVDPEERFCDGIATKIVGTRLDRAWWRRRVRQISQKI